MKQIQIECGLGFLPQVFSEPMTEAQLGFQKTPAYHFPPASAFILWLMTPKTPMSFIDKITGVST